MAYIPTKDRKVLWRELIDAPQYEISNDGRLRVTKTGKACKARLDKDGYMVISIVINKQPTSKKIHRLVAEHFLEGWNDELIVDHNDFNRANNSDWNLTVMTQMDNIKHSREEGRYKASDRRKTLSYRGEGNPNFGKAKLRKLSLTKRKRVQRLYREKGYSQDKLAKVFKVSQVSISKILKEDLTDPKYTDV